MTDPSDDKDRPAAADQPVSYEPPAPADPAPYDPPSTAEPFTYTPLSFDTPDATAATPPPLPDTSLTSDSFAAPTVDVPPGQSPFAPPAAETVAENLPPGSYETPAAQIPGMPAYPAPGNVFPAAGYPGAPANTYGQPYAPPPPYGQPYGPPMQAPQSQETGLAIGALVCSILGLCSCVTVIAGLVMGHIALGKVSRGQGGGRGIAVAAVIVGYSVVALWGAFFITLIVLGVNGRLDS